MLRNLKYTVISSICLLFVACTEVDICDSNVQHPHVAEIDFKWNGADADSVVVLAYRVVNTWRCGYILNPDTKEGHYIYNSIKIEDRENSTDGTNGNTDNETVEDNQGNVNDEAVNDNQTTDDAETVVDDYSILPFVTKCGELYFTAFNYDTENEYLTCGKFVNGRVVGAEHATVGYKRTYSKNNAPLAQDWSELNPGYKYVSNIPDEADVYYGTEMYDIEEGVVNEIEMTPKGVLQPIKVNINIESQGVIVDKVVAEISGISANFNFFRGTPNRDNTYKVLFELDSNHSSTINVLGLVRSNSFTSVKGNGVLQVAVHVNGKVYNAQMNLFNTINAYGEVIAGGIENVVLNIDAPLIVTSEGLKTESVDSYPDKWVVK